MAMIVDRKPKLRQAVLDHFTSAVKGEKPPPFAGETSQLRKELRYAPSFTFDDVLTILKERWEEAGRSDVEWVVEVLMDYRLITRHGNKEAWTVTESLRPPPPPQPTLVHSTSRWQWRNKKNKSGVCLSCGMYVSYKNRHNRGGSGHTGEQCALEKIRRIMAE